MPWNLNYCLNEALTLRRGSCWRLVDPSRLQALAWTEGGGSSVYREQPRCLFGIFLPNSALRQSGARYLC